MSRDIAFTASRSVAPPPVRRHTKRSQESRRTAFDASQDLAVLSQHAHRDGEVGRIPLPADVGFGRSQRSAKDNIAIEAAIVNVKRRNRAV